MLAVVVVYGSIVVYVLGMVVVSVQVLRELVTYGIVDVQVERDVELSWEVSTHLQKGRRGLFLGHSRSSDVLRNGGADHGGGRQD